VRWLPRELAIEGWALETRGYVQSATSCAPRDALGPTVLPPAPTTMRDEHADRTVELAA
jgi:hypothetical protein